MTGRATEAGIENEGRQRGARPLSTILPRSLHAKAKGRLREPIAWGYVFKGKLVYHTADGDIEIIDGEAY
jgi:hypothetical protein